MTKFYVEQNEECDVEGKTDLERDKFVAKWSEEFLDETINFYKTKGFSMAEQGNFMWRKLTTMAGWNMGCQLFFKMELNKDEYDKQTARAEWELGVSYPYISTPTNPDPFY